MPVADQVEIKCATPAEYVKSLTVMCFMYWRADGAELQEWTMRAVRGETPTDEPKRSKCARCGADRIALKKVHNVVWCLQCIAEFVKAKTMMERKELPAP